MKNATSDEIDVRRQKWLSALSALASEDVGKMKRSLGLPAFKSLRAPEIGSVMVRGRMGGNGDAFNLGEMSVARASIELETGEVGHGYVQGRNKEAAEFAAICDALLQTDRADDVTDIVLSKLEKAKENRATQIQNRAEKTRVEFFTMTRGEDE